MTNPILHPQQHYHCYSTISILNSNPILYHSFRTLTLQSHSTVTNNNNCNSNHNNSNHKHSTSLILDFKRQQSGGGAAAGTTAAQQLENNNQNNNNNNKNDENNENENINESKTPEDVKIIKGISRYKLNKKFFINTRRSSALYSDRYGIDKDDESQVELDEINIDLINSDINNTKHDGEGEDDDDGGNRRKLTRTKFNAEKQREKEKAKNQDKQARQSYLKAREERLKTEFQISKELKRRYYQKLGQKLENEKPLHHQAFTRICFEPSFPAKYEPTDVTKLDVCL